MHQHSHHSSYITREAARRLPPFRHGLQFLLTFLIVVLSAVWIHGAPSVTSQDRRPNVVLLITDDQRFDTLEHMPIVQHELVGRGVTFTNAYATTPHCCPSRASILTGQYAQTHGVLRNSGSSGGWRGFDDRSTMATWLQNAGFRTMLAGKYLNLYRSYVVPQGWEEWFAIWDTGDKFKNYTVNHNGQAHFYPDRETLYSTRVLRDQALHWLKEDDTRPFFLYLSFDGPHAPAEPTRRDRESFAELRQHLPSFNENDVSDKPSWVQRLPELDAGDQRKLDQFRRRQLQSLQVIDRAIGAIVEQLRTDGRLENTWFIFLSDNGMSLGEHRYGPHKSCGYEECVRIPIVVTPPTSTNADANEPRVNDRLVLNIDIAPTVAEISGVDPDSRVDGTSLVSLLNEPAGSWREEARLELWTDQSSTTFKGIRRGDWKFIRYDNGEQELYNLIDDPYELENLITRIEHARLIQSLSASIVESPPE
ncbi:MAG: sulfatase [Chloroflexota bacterium]